ASGGHPRPVHIRADGSASMVESTGTLLGAFDTIACVPCEAQLGPGDTLVFYTDGVTDVAPPYDLDDDALVQLISASTSSDNAEDVAERIHAEIERIKPLADRSDDIALLVLRITG